MKIIGRVKHSRVPLVLLTHAIKCSRIRSNISRMQVEKRQLRQLSEKWGFESMSPVFDQVGLSCNAGYQEHRKRK